MSEFNFKNKVAVVTGGAGGIGYAIAEEFLKNETKIVILLDITESGIDASEKLNTKYGSDKTVFIKCDLTKDVDNISQHIFENYKKVDILVNCAGVGNISIRKTMEINAIALMELTMKFYEHMTEYKDGTILNISSVYGFYIDAVKPFYKASKFAVMGFSRCLGHEENYTKSGVRVIVLCPGATRTNMVSKETWEYYTKISLTQEPKDAARAAVEVVKYAKSGSAWQVMGGKCTELLFDNPDLTGGSSVNTIKM